MKMTPLEFFIVWMISGIFAVVSMGLSIEHTLETKGKTQIIFNEYSCKEIKK